MTLPPDAMDWRNRLMARCIPGITPGEWWAIGNDMHTLNGDIAFKLNYGYTADGERKCYGPLPEWPEELGEMWDTWKACKPLEKVTE